MEHFFTGVQIDNYINIRTYEEENKLLKQIGKFFDVEQTNKVIKKYFSDCPRMGNANFVSIGSFIHMLETIYSYELNLNQLSGIDFKSWMKKITEMINDKYNSTVPINIQTNYLRSLSALINDEKNLKIEIEKINKNYEIIDCVKTDELKNLFEKSLYNEKKIYYDQLVLIIPAIKRAVKLTFSFDLKESQIIAILIFLKKPKHRGLLAQILTGEGKTMIITILASILALFGHQVDIVTSSEFLARRDSQEQAKLYNLLGLKVSNNIEDGNERGSKNCYESQIVYGTVHSFLVDILKDEFMREETLCKRKPDILIVDEVDSMFIDEHNTATLLGKQRIGMEKFSMIFMLTWTLITNIEANSHVNKEKTNDIKSSVKKRIDEVLQNGLSDFKIYFSDNEHEFINANLSDWIDSAFLAKQLNENHQYIIQDSKIVPVDSENTGMFQKNSHLSDGLQQFLQIKHGLDITPLNLTTNYKSNVSFFKRYINTETNNIYGMTGTLGSDAARKFLNDIYEVDLFDFPASQPNKRQDLPGLIRFSEKSWIKKIVQSICDETSRKRPVLIICESINTVDYLNVELEKVLDKESKNQKFIFRSLLEENKLLKCSDILIIKHLAERGADIKLTEDVEKYGGLHVIFTYLPSNQRIQDQTFNRIFKNSSGTSQLIIEYSQVLNKFGIYWPNDIEFLKNYESKSGLVDDLMRETVQDLAFCNGIEGLKNYREKEEYSIKIIKNIEREALLFKILCSSIDCENIDMYRKNAIENKLKVWLNKQLENNDDDADFENCFQVFLKEFVDKAKSNKYFNELNDEKINKINKETNTRLKNNLRPSNFFDFSEISHCCFQNIDKQNEFETVLRTSDESLEYCESQYMAYIHKGVAHYMSKNGKSVEAVANFGIAIGNIKKRAISLKWFVELSEYLKCNENLIDEAKMKLKFYKFILNILNENLRKIENDSLINDKLREMKSDFHLILSCFNKKKKKLKNEMTEQGLYHFRFNRHWFKRNLTILSSLGIHEIILGLLTFFFFPSEIFLALFAMATGGMNIMKSFYYVVNGKNFDWKNELSKDIGMVFLIVHILKDVVSKIIPSAKLNLKHVVTGKFLTSIYSKLKSTFKTENELIHFQSTASIKEYLKLQASDIMISQDIKTDIKITDFYSQFRKKIKSGLIKLFNNETFRKECRQLNSQTVNSILENLDLKSLIKEHIDDPNNQSIQSFKNNVEIIINKINEAVKNQINLEKFKNQTFTENDTIFKIFQIHLDANLRLLEKEKIVEIKVKENAFNQSKNKDYFYKSEDIRGILNQIKIEYEKENDVLFLDPLNKDNFSTLNICVSLIKEKKEKKTVAFLCDIGNLHWIAGVCVINEQLDKINGLLRDSSGFSNLTEFNLTLDDYNKIDFKCNNSKIDKENRASCGIYSIQNLKIILEELKCKDSEFLSNFSNFDLFCTQADASILRSSDFANKFVLNFFQKSFENIIINRHHQSEIENINKILENYNNLENIFLIIELDDWFKEGYNYSYKFHLNEDLEKEIISTVQTDLSNLLKLESEKEIQVVNERVFKISSSIKTLEYINKKEKMLQIDFFNESLAHDFNIALELTKNTLNLDGNYFSKMIYLITSSEKYKDYINKLYKIISEKVKKIIEFPQDKQTMDDIKNLKDTSNWITNCNSLTIENLPEESYSLLIQSEREYSILDVTNDNNSLWSAISLALIGTENCMLILRCMTALKIISNEDYFRKIIGNYDFNNFVIEAIDEKKVGGKFHIFALSISLNRPIRVFHHDSNVQNQDKLSGKLYYGINKTNDNPLNLVFENNQFKCIIKRNSMDSFFGRSTESLEILNEPIFDNERIFERSTESLETLTSEFKIDNERIFERSTESLETLTSEFKIDNERIFERSIETLKIDEKIGKNPLNIAKSYSDNLVSSESTKSNIKQKETDMKYTNDRTAYSLEIGNMKIYENPWTAKQQLLKKIQGNLKSIVQYTDIIFKESESVTVPEKVDELMLKLLVEKKEIEGNGLCFINSLRYFFQYVLKLKVELNDIRERLRSQMLNDLIFLEPYFTNKSIKLVDEITLRFSDLFDKGLYNNDFVDILVNCCGSYFGLNFLILDAQESGTNLILVKNRPDYNYPDNNYPRYEKIIVVLIRTSIKLGNVRFAYHYDLALPLEFKDEEK